MFVEDWRTLGEMQTHGCGGRDSGFVSPIVHLMSLIVAFKVLRSDKFKLERR